MMRTWNLGLIESDYVNYWLRSWGATQGRNPLR